MYKVVIVDDEQWIRKWLDKMVRTLCGEAEVAGVFADSVMALDYIKREPVDIVITDIRMPVISGLEMMEQAQKAGCHAKFIVVSGYSEFEYVKKAMQLDAVDYLLKPLEKADLKQQLEKAIERIKQEQMNRQLSGLVKDTLYKYVNLFLSNESGFDFKELDRWAKHGGMCCEELLAGCIQMSLLEEGTDYKERLEAAAGAYGYDREQVVCICHQSFFYFFLLADGESSRERGYFKHLLEEAFPQNRFVVGKWMADLEAIPQEITRIKQEFAYQKREMAVNGSMRHADEAAWKDLVVDVRAGKEEVIPRKLENLKEYYEDNGYSIEECRLSFFQMTYDLMKLIEEPDEELRFQYLLKGYDFCVMISEYQDLAVMFEWLEHYIGQIISLRKKEANRNLSAIIKEVCNYIFEHYQEEISAAEICSRYGISSTYFSRKFKEEVGMGYMDFLMNVRMDAGKRLLRYSKRTVKDIASRTGFHDARYFSRVFYGKEGCTPIEYREKHAGDGGKEHEV